MKYDSSKIAYSNKEILQELDALLTGRWITDLCNTSALLMSRCKDINWVGFYLVQPDNPQMLWLGPFQGQPACTFIPFFKGVCGTAAGSNKTVRVKNVDEFPGHIVCDSKSKSELVIPIVKYTQVIGVLDIDSPALDRFSEGDQIFFENVVKTLMIKN